MKETERYFDFEFAARWYAWFMRKLGYEVDVDYFEDCNLFMSWWIVTKRK